MPTTSNYAKRIEYALSQLNDWFDRKEYLNICKGISTAIASRDIKQLLKDGLIYRIFNQTNPFSLFQLYTSTVKNSTAKTICKS